RLPVQGRQPPRDFLPLAANVERSQGRDGSRTGGSGELWFHRDFQQERFSWSGEVWHSRTDAERIPQADWRAAMSTISLRLPESLHESARELAKREHISINQLVTLALAEKISALATEEYLEKRAK